MGIGCYVLFLELLFFVMYVNKVNMLENVIIVFKG